MAKMSKMRPIPFLTLMFLFNQPFDAQSTCSEYYGDFWTPTWTNETEFNASTTNKARNDMLCSKNCYENIEKLTKEEEKCCTCNNCMIWEGSEIDLYIEYISVLGKSLVLSDQAPTDYEVYKIEHTDSEMSAIPSNICDWDKDVNLMEYYKDQFKNMENFINNIVTINFEGNKISDIPDLNCLSRLNSLNLRNNDILFIGNSSISYLSNLRIIDFSGNSIQYINPNTIASPYLSFFSANFSFNEMTKLDVSNAMSLYPFCKIDYKSNEITDITNEESFKLDLTQTYGPGFVNIQNNKISTFPDFKELFSLNSLAQLGSLLSFGFDFQGIPIVCDCNLEPFMTLAKSIISVVWRDYFNVTCTAPPALAGVPVADVDPALFICPILAGNGCQTPECTCVDKPNEDTLVVDCSNAGLTEMPKLPYSKFSKYISLDVSGNKITKLDHYPLLSKLSTLNISRNNLKEIDKYEAQMLENATYIDLSHNPRLMNLPQTIHYHNICSRNMDGLHINCNCDSLWIKTWVKKKCIISEQLFQCVMPDNSKELASNFIDKDIECFKSGNIYILLTIIISVILLFVIIIGTVLYFFRYEVLIICLCARQNKHNVIAPSFEYDVFLSYKDDDENVSKWVQKILEKNLIKKGYKIFRSNCDVPFGNDRDSYVISTMAKTKNFLVIMTDSYLQEEDGIRSWTENEWKYGWNNFKSDRSKNIVLVNFDHLSSFELNHPQIKAFLRVGSTVDFKNHDRKIMQEIYKKLGTPWQKLKVKVDKIKMLAEPNKVSHFFPLKEYEANMKVDSLITQDEVQKFETVSNDPHGISVSQTDVVFDTESIGIQSRCNTPKMHSNHKTCKHRKCYACQLRDQRVNLPGNVKFNKTMAIFTVIPSSSRPNSSCSRR